MIGIPQFSVPPINKETGQWNREWWLFFNKWWQSSVTSTSTDFSVEGAENDLSGLDAGVSVIDRRVNDLSALLAVAPEDSGKSADIPVLMTSLELLLQEGQDLLDRVNKARQELTIEQSIPADFVRSMAYQEASNVNITGGSITGIAFNASTVSIADDSATNATYYPLWATSTGGQYAPKTSTAKLSWNPSTGTLTATVVNAALNGTLGATTPAAATVTTINKVTITTPATSATLTIANGKALTANNSIALSGTDSTTMTFPSTSATIARTDAGQTFAGNQQFSGNVGIGLSPSAPLDVLTTSQGISNLLSSNASGGYVTLGRSGASSIIGSYSAASGGGATINADALFFRCANGIGFGPAGAAVYASLDTSGIFLLRASTSGLGYGAGAGSTVTQATSRTTGVTINAPSGAITLVSAAGTTSWQTFTVTNSTVAASDVVRVVQKSGTDKYQIHVTNVAAGSFAVTFATTGGTTTEQPVFNFVVIKGSTA